MGARKYMKSIIKIACIAFVVFVIFYIGLAMFAIGGEHLMAKWDLDNAYIDSQYENWKKVTTSTGEPFMIPEHWNYVEDHNGIRITDKKDNVIAKGIDLQKDASVAKEAFLSDLLSYPVDEIKETCHRAMRINRTGEVTAIGEKKETIPYIRLWTENRDIYLYFTDVPVSDEKWQEIAEAIVYAFAYYDEAGMFRDR